jgi:hypothetical protein
MRQENSRSEKKIKRICFGGVGGDMDNCHGLEIVQLKTWIPRAESIKVRKMKHREMFPIKLTQQADWLN